MGSVELQSPRMKVFIALTALEATASAAPQIFRAPGVVGHGVVGHHGLVGHGVVGHSVAHAVAPVVHAAVHAIAHPVAHAVAEVYPAEISPYTYNYAVADDYSNSNFNAGESSDGAGNAEGSYSVALPDSRIQHVNYRSDPVNGYVAEVTYDGTAAFPPVAAPVAVANRVVHAAPVVAHAAPVYTPGG